MMPTMRIIFSRLAGLLRRRRAEAELERELAEHRALLIAEHMAAGLGEAAARQAAARELGPVEAMKERYRDRLAPRWLEWLGQDLRFAFRQMRRAPLFAALAIVSLAVGIGANATVFNWLDGALLRPLPVEQPGQLAALWRRWQGASGASENFSFPELRDLAGCPALSGVAAFWSGAAQMGRGAHGRRVFDFEVGENYFRVVRPHFILGRGFTPQEGGPGGGQPVAVVSYRFWREQLGGDPHVLGRTILLDQIPFTIVGVTGPGFIGTERILDPGLFLPLAMTNRLDPGFLGNWRTQWRNSDLWNIVRLKPGVSLGSARAALTAWLVHAGRAHPQSFADGNRLGLAPPGLLDPDTRNNVHAFGLVLLAAAGLVLLLACANLAGLWLARGLARRRETAIRLALGCSRRRLIAQHLTEVFLLAIFGAAGGLALAEWADHALLSLRRLMSWPITLQLGMDWRVLAFTAAVTIAAALLCGVLPAWRATRADPAREFAGGAGAGGAQHLRWRGGLIGFQVALAAIAAIFAGLMLRSLGVIAGQSPGFEARHVLQASFNLREQGLSQAQGRQFERELLARARRLPGVTSAGLGYYVPLGEIFESTLGFALPGGKTWPSAAWVQTSPGYFRTLGIPMLRGRDFTAADDAHSTKVAIINQALARRVFGSASAVGRQIRTSVGSREVIGVTGNFDIDTIGDTHENFIAMPLAQEYRSHFNLLLRIAGPPAAMAPAVRALVAQTNPNLAIASIAPVERVLDFALLPARLAAVMLGIFALLALAIAAIGVYGVVAQGVVQRTAEIGTRMALGARPADVVGLMLRQLLRPAGAGLAIGLAAAWTGTGVLAAFLYGIHPRDALSFAGAIAALILIAAAAACIPARRALRIQPARALREM